MNIPMNIVFRPLAGPSRLCFVLLSAIATVPIAGAGTTRRASVDSAGIQGNNSSIVCSISGNGRFVAFQSVASNLVVGDTNGVSDIFVHDRKKGKTKRVSVDSSGIQGNNSSANCSISSNGRFVAFYSSASNLVAGDTNGVSDVFVHDRKKGKTTRVSVDSAGIQGNNSSTVCSISGNGRFVVFQSSASSLVAGDTNSADDVFVHDRKKGRTVRASVSSAGIQGNSGSGIPAISANGRFTAFYSSASNLVAGDTNGSSDVFVHDRKKGTTVRASVDSAGIQGNGSSITPSISGNGRFVTFRSSASNLVAGDTNSVFDVFVRDRKKSVTTRVSVNSAAIEGNLGSHTPSISGNGRFVAFYSEASNFVPGDANNREDVFVHDRKKGTTTCASLDSAGTIGNNDSVNPSISSNGRFVAFQSSASNLVPGDGNGASDIFIRDRK